MTRIGDRIAQKIGAGIGFAAEANASRKARKASNQDKVDSVGSGSNYDTAAPEHINSEDVDDDETEWRLDEVVQQVTSTYPKPPTGNMVGPATIDKLVAAFIESHSDPIDDTAIALLQCPVIIPQRRPEKRERGMVRAYAPMLLDCGIDQATFLSFLDFFDEAVQLSPIFQVVNMAGMVVANVPSPTAMAVSVALSAVGMIGGGAFTRTRINDFLTQMNEKFFKPRHLFCMLITYLPDDDTEVETIDINEMAVKNLNRPEEGMNSQFKKLRGSDGKTRKSQLDSLDVAPLIFPDLDKASEAQKASISVFAKDYFDRRAQATFATQNPDSALATDAQFSSKWGDPNSIQSKKNLKSFLTGGMTDRPHHGDRLRTQLNEKRDAKLSQLDKVRPLKMVKKTVKQRVLYLMVVNLP